MTRYCTKCGAELKSDSKFCPKCGAEIVDSQNIIEKNKHKNRKRVFAVSGLVIAIILIGCVSFQWYYLHQNEKVGQAAWKLHRLCGMSVYEENYTSRSLSPLENTVCIYVDKMKKIRDEWKIQKKATSKETYDNISSETPKSNNVESTSKSIIFTKEQIAFIKQQLGVPDSENIIMTVSDSPYYWETGECTLVNVTFTENGEIVAGADVNVDTAECTTSLYTYTPKG